MGGFFRFDKMITPILITIFFWVGVIIALISGFTSIWIGIFSEEGNVFQVPIGIGMLVLGPIIIRIYCEMFIVLFKIQSTLVQLRDMQENNNDL